MLSDRLELLISSCDKYSDLWDLQIYHLNKNWANRNMRSVIVTDTTSKKAYENIQIFAAGNELEMPQRIKKVLETVSTEYVFITLDDYFLIEEVDNQKIENLLNAMDQYKLDYIRLFPIPEERKVLDKGKKLYWINLDRNYAVNLYPGIWRKSFLEATVNSPLDAWKYEVSLTSVAKANNFRCAMSKENIFMFVDVIRKGKLLNKANKYLASNGMKLERELISRKEEFKLNLMFWAKKYFPKKIQKLIKKVMSLFGMKFISEGI